MPEEPQDSRMPSDDEISERLRRAADSAQGGEQLDIQSEEELERQLREMGLYDEEEDFSERELKRLDGKLSEAREQAQSGQVADEFEERFQSLEAKVRQKREQQEANEKETARRRSSEREDARGLGLGLTIAYAIVGFPLIGWGAGWLVDRSTGTDVWKSLGMLGGAVLGIVAAVIMINRNNRDS